MSSSSIGPTAIAWRAEPRERPGCVLQADFLNGLIDDTILVQITSKAHGIPGTEVTLDPAREPAAGLLHLCVASCMNLLTADPDIIDQRIGYLSDAAMQQIADCVKEVLELP